MYTLLQTINRDCFAALKLIILLWKLMCLWEVNTIKNDLSPEITFKLDQKYLNLIIQVYELNSTDDGESEVSSVIVHMYCMLCMSRDHMLPVMCVYNP